MHTFLVRRNQYYYVTDATEVTEVYTESSIINKNNKEKSNKYLHYS